jgi:hypothetical protein
MGGETKVCLVSASRQNAFFSEILEALGVMLEEEGVKVEASLDCFPALEQDVVYLFVPHEFKALVREIAQPTRAQLRRTVALCTEQPGTQWFELSASLAARCGAVLDINSLGVEQLRSRGTVADHLPLGYVPAWDHWGGEEPEEDRSVDLVFLGGYTERRGHLLARCAPHLHDRRTAIRLAEPSRPHAVGEATFWSGAEKWRLLADSRLLLNVHRTALPYLEWHRFLGAQINGCVVLSEHCIGTEPLRPGRDYLSAGYWQLPGVVGAALEDPGRLAQISLATYRFLREELPASRTTEALRAAIERARANPLPRAAEPAPAAVPLPEPEPVPKPPWQAYAEYAGESLALRQGVKHLVTRMQNLERGLAELIEAGGEEVEIRSFGPELHEPRVSVILTVHNYADHVGGAIASVALSSLEEVELVAVDDASTDGSVAVVEAAARRYPWLPLTHIRLRRNRGLPLARNLAIDHARAELVFVLDADNEVLPDGLALLAAALEHTPGASFAYGIIETFDEKGPRDLLSWHPWDPAKLRQGNYIDAMAMIRRPALEEIGGYASDPALYGWEDYELWLHLVDRGHEGIQVPSFIGRYRSAQHSMIALSNIDATAAWGAVLRRYPALGRPLETFEAPLPEPVPATNS